MGRDHLPLGHRHDDTVALGGAVRLGPSAPGVERLRARFGGRPFEPHRHASYAIGLTTAGVQSFRYRGRDWHGLPGQVHVLHPDELHDGRAGDGGVFAYRMLYLDPALLQAAAGTAALPHVAEAVVSTPHLDAAAAAWLWGHQGDADMAGDALAVVDTVGAAAALLWAHAGGTPPAALRHPAMLDQPALRRVHERLASDPAAAVDAAELERLAGLDRWSLARQFRLAYGTSPSGLRRDRQVALARRHLLSGQTLAASALAAGFADQSHFTRQFKRLHGVPPGRWLQWVRQGGATLAP